MSTLNPPTRSTPSPKGISAENTLNESIVRLHRRLILRSVLWWIGGFAGVLSAVVVLDMAFHFGAIIRWMLFAGLIASAAWGYRRWVARTLGIVLTSSDLALNLTHPEPILAAIVDLPDTTTSDPIERALIEAINEQSSRHLNQSAARATLRRGPMYEMIGIVLGLVLLGILSINTPALIQIGARRTLAPWTQVQWPKRFKVQLLEQAKHHPADRAFLAGATIGPSLDDPDASVRWRLVDSQNRSIINWTTLALNKQHQTQDGQLYEQLLPIHTLSAKSIPDGTQLEYRIKTRDDQSPIQRIAIVHPPKLLRVESNIVLPEYADGLDASVSRFIAGQHTLNPSSLSLGPVLAGSSVSLRWVFDSSVRESDSDLSISIAVEKIISPTQSDRIEIHVADQYGTSPRGSMDMFVRVVSDAPPEAIITSPSTDLVVGQRAMVQIAGLVTDDLGLSSASIDRETIGESTDTIRMIEINPDRLQRQSIHADLDVEKLSLEPGKSVEVVAIGLDIGGLEGRSPPRMLRIVEDQDIIEQVETQLGSISEILRRLDDQQRELIAQTQRSQASPNNQAALTEQLQSRIKSIDTLEQQLEQSRIRDPQLTPMLDALDHSLSNAKDQSEQASRALEREKTPQAIEQMQAVRDELELSMAMLDRGQDTWLARRAIQELRTKVQELLDETQQLNKHTAGKSIDQLTKDQRSMLQKILEKQRQTANDARETLDGLDQQANALDQNNPTGAQGIRDAATQGRNSGIEEQLAQAGEEIAQNQTSSAAGTQQQVLEELNKMLEHIDQAQKNRDSALRRKLASLIESIKAIIDDQNHELARIDQGEPNLDQPLITLRTNTLAIRDEAAEAFPETQSIADSLSRATDSQAKAIGALRAIPVNLNLARQSELAALVHLQAALDEAEKQDEAAADRQAQQLRDQLKERYQSALDTQSNITTQTQPLIGQQLTRRQRAKARQLSGQEDTLNTELRDMLDQTSELSDAPVFALAHNQMELLLDSVSSDLMERTLDQQIIQDQQSFAMILSALVEVLGDSPQPESEDFEDGQNAGGGGQGGGGPEPVIPPIAQLRLLRSLQQLTAIQTHALSESDAPDPVRIDQIGQLQRDLAQKGQQLIQDMNQTPQPDEQSNEESAE